MFLLIAMDFYEKNDRENGDKTLREMKPLWEEAMKNCPESNAQFYRIIKHQEEFFAQSDAKEKIAEAIVKHGSTINLLTYVESSEYARGHYYKSGEAAGNIEKLVIGAPDDSPLCKPPKRDMSKDDQTAPGQFVAGWLYGITTLDERDYIMQCYESDDMLTSFLYAAFENYFAGNEQLGDAMMHCTRPLYEKALGKCDKSADVLTKLDQYYVKWESQPNADELKKKAYEANKDWCDKEFGFIQKTWTEGVFFDTGMFSGQVQAMLEGKPDLGLVDTTFLN